MSSTSQETTLSPDAPDENSRFVRNADPETAERRRAKILLVEDEAIGAGYQDVAAASWPRSGRRHQFRR